MTTTSGSTCAESVWKRFPVVAAEHDARRWIENCIVFGLANNTVIAYARAVEGFLVFCQKRSLEVRSTTRDSIAQYLGELRSQPRHEGADVVRIDSGARLSNATLQLRITAVRLFFDFLVEDGFIRTNPVSRGRYFRSTRSGNCSERALIPKFHKLPWVPSEEQWSSVLTIVAGESPRNRCMFTLAYDAALRREELCQLRSDDIDPAHRLLRIRAETTKSRRERVLPYSSVSGELLRNYLKHRQKLSSTRGRLFLSESPRNYAAPISMWTWSKVVRSIALRAEVPAFSTHTLRHLCLTDLARAGWDLHEIATLAGHRNLDTTRQYIHLSARDLVQRFSETMDQLHEWRLQTLAGSPVSEKTT
jgi:site-specific recombinase XerD